MRAAAESERPPDLDWQAPHADGPVRARLRPPGSKSVTNRALVLAALANGPTVITNPLQARDTLLMAAALRSLGATIDEDAPGHERAAGAVPEADPAQHGSEPDDSTGTAPSWLVTPASTSGPAAVDVGNAGTVLRFVPPVATLARGDVEFRGDERAAQRPVGPLLGALRELGAAIDEPGPRGALFTVRGRGGIAGGSITLDASGSSQLISGLLLSAPRFGKGAEVRHEGPRVPSAPLIAMTVQMLRDAGAEVETRVSGRRQAGDPADVPDQWRVQPGGIRPSAIAVEPDLPNASPFLAAALVTAGSVTIDGWPERTSQAAGQILDVLTRMGAVCSPAAGGVTVTGTGTIRGITADLRDINELAPVLTAVAALADSPSVFTGIGHMRKHESNRLAALATEIMALGGDVTELDDGLEVRPRPLRGEGVIFASHDDHRLVMAAAVLGLAVPGGILVGNASTVAKTFPGFPAAWASMLERSL